MDKHEHDPNHSDSDEDAEPVELIYEDDELRGEYLAAREWLMSLTPSEVLSPRLFDPNEMSKLSTQYKTQYSKSLCVVDNFIDHDILSKIREELEKLDYILHRTESYIVNQSVLPLTMARPPLTTKMCQILRSDDFLQALSSLTGLQCLSQPRQDGYIFHSVAFQDTFTILPTSTTLNRPQPHPLHDKTDSNLKRIGFYIFATPEWDSTQYGGNIDFYTHCTTPFPNKSHHIASIKPEYGRAVFFELDDPSFMHCISPLTIPSENDCTNNNDTDDDAFSTKTLLCISGWFTFMLPSTSTSASSPSSLVKPYIPSITPQYPSISSSSSLSPSSILIPPCYRDTLHESPPPATSPNQHTYHTITQSTAAVSNILLPSDDLSSWINPTYLDMNTIQQVQEYFMDESSIDLQDFLLPSIFDKISSSILYLSTHHGINQSSTVPVSLGNSISHLLEHVASSSLPSSSSSSLSNKSLYDIPGPLSHSYTLRLCSDMLHYYYTDQLSSSPRPSSIKTQDDIKLYHESILYILSFYQFLYSESLWDLIGMYTGCKPLSGYAEITCNIPGSYQLPLSLPSVSQNKKSKTLTIPYYMEGLDMHYTLYAPSLGNNDNEIMDCGGVYHYCPLGRTKQLNKQQYDAIQLVESTRLWAEQRDQQQFNIQPGKVNKDGYIPGSSQDPTGIPIIQPVLHDSLISILPIPNTLSLVYRSGPDDPIMWYKSPFLPPTRQNTTTANTIPLICTALVTFSQLSQDDDEEKEEKRQTKSKSSTVHNTQKKKVIVSSSHKKQNKKATTTSKSQQPISKKRSRSTTAATTPQPTIKKRRK